MTKDNFEKELPDGYELKLRVDAKNKKTTIIYFVLSCVPVLIAAAISVLLVAFVRGFSGEGTILRNFITLLITIVVGVLYMVLHELTHGLTYKILTGAKLKFGVSWNVAFCGVPDIYVYRKATKIAVVMPFIVFNVIFAGLTVGMYFVSDIAFIAAFLLFGVHVGGCVGDLHVTYMLDHKFKDNKTLIRDTGPEQCFYTYNGNVKDKEESNDKKELKDKDKPKETKEQTVKAEPAKKAKSVKKAVK